MSIPIELKETLLKSFYQKLDQPGWNFDGCESPPPHLLLLLLPLVAG
jgi:hypothetical protein